MSNILKLHFLSITFIFFFLTLPYSKGQTTKYEVCSTLYSCGKIQNIGYPFWGGNRPVFCGVPDFRLNCLNGDDYPTMVVYTGGSVGLYVQEINTSANIISVSRKRILESCYMHDTSNITLLRSLNPDSSYRVITLFYGCPSCVSEYQSKNFTCSNSDDHTIHPVYYFENSSDVRGMLRNSCSCSNNVSVPVDTRGFGELHSRNSSLWDILTDWPVRLEYTVNFEACSKCEESGGRCGSSVDNPSLNQFLCHCEDGAQASVCRQQSGGGRTMAIVGSGVAAVLGTLLLFGLAIFVKRHRRNNTFSFIFSIRKKGDENMSAFLESYGPLNPKRYTYSEIRKMTNSFKDKLGEGGFGSVFKGKLHDGRFVAVKKLKILKDDGKEFFNEVLSMSKTSHVNIVAFLGFCFEGKHRALVFEYLSNGSLEKFIYGGENNKSLELETTFNIAVGIAKGLDYLHNGCNTKILHFDIKPHNILLDEDFHPKISDFGLARLIQQKNSMVSMSEARGTIGYMAPEIFSRSFGNASQKSDVFSYGMMLLDLVCGKRKKAFDAKSTSEIFFPAWVYNQLEPMEDVVNDVMKDEKKRLERKMIQVSLWCIQTYPSNRPPMNRVVEMLEGPLESLQMPPKPYIGSPERVLFDDSPLSEHNVRSSI